MTDKKVNTKDMQTPQETDGKTQGLQDERHKSDAFRSPLLAWISVALTLLAWLFLMTVNGYLAFGVALAAAICGCAAIRGRKRSICNIAITSIIASTVLLVVLAAFVIVIKIGLQA